MIDAAETEVAEGEFGGPEESAANFSVVCV